MNDPLTHSAIPVLAAGILLFSCLHAQDQGNPFPNRDKWAGKPVLDPLHVDQMVHGRLHNAPKVGEKAPPAVFIEAVTGNAVSLAQLHSRRPVVLFFGSYSCICAQESSPPIKRISEKYRDLCQFVLIYIREAHPVGGFPNPVRGGHFDVPARTSFPNRSLLAIQFAKERQFKFPVCVDSMDDRLAVRWGAWPVRLFVIDRSGTVVFAGQQGPWFHKPTRDYDPRLSNVPKSLGGLPGYSQGSLEEFLEKLASRKEAAKKQSIPQSPEIEGHHPADRKDGTDDG